MTDAVLQIPFVPQVLNTSEVLDRAKTLAAGATFLKEFLKSERSPPGELHIGSAVRNRLFLILVGDL